MCFRLQKLAEQLGMGSIEELEQALDAMAGIDTDGGEIDTSDVREARVRSAYLDWCKEYGKTADESRFPTFSSNFLAMEEYAQENGREMVLNKYADCTEEEYRQVTNTQCKLFLYFQFSHTYSFAHIDCSPTRIISTR